MSANEPGRVMEELYETSQGLCASGIMDKRTFEAHKALYLAGRTPKYTGEDVKEIRAKLNISQAVLASLMNTSASAVRAWEAGSKKPGGPSNRLLQLLDKKGLEVLL